MDIILTHARADFDAFASMLCASKLFPQAVPVLPSQLIYKLKELLSLYRDVADFQSLKFLKKAKTLSLGQVIVVDTKKRGQLTEFEPYIAMADEVRVFDHHPPTLDDLARSVVDLYPYGANATGLFLKAAGQGVQFTPQEATIIMLGIYADTGNLTYPGTCAEDALAVSQLLGMDADLQTINQYLRPYFDPDQRNVFREMLTTAREMDMEGYKVVLVKMMLDRPLQGISGLLSQVSDMVGADAIFGVFASKGKPGVQIVVQSLVPEIHAGEITGHFDGGGHPGAAAALLPRADMDGVADTLMELLTEVPLPCAKVKDFMTTDVVTVRSDMSMQETGELLVRRGIHGAPVVDGTGRVTAVISLRDVDKARAQNLLHAPTSAFMSQRLMTTTPEANLITVRKVITSRDIGRLPVMVDHRLIGIISRSDVLRGLNGHGRRDENGSGA